MSCIRVLHAADLHLDSPFEGLPDDKAAVRRQNQRLLLSRLADTVRTENVQLVLLAGDLLDTGNAYMETAEELIRALGSVDVPVFIAPGNHDYFSARSPYARLTWPKNVYIFKYPHIECVYLPKLNVRVWGAGYNDTHCPALLHGFEAVKENETVDIMCIHGEVGVRDSSYAPVSADDISGSGMDYIAFGHIHKESGLQRSGDTYYAWPGCPEGRGFDETGEKYIYLVDIDPGRCTIKPVSIAGCRYEIKEIDLSGEVDIIEQIPAGTENDVYRLVLKGETDAAPDVQSLKRSLEGKFFALQIKDRTTVRRDIWDKAGEDTLRGLFLKKLKERYDSAQTDEERILAQQAARWGLAALDNREGITHENK